MIIKKLIKQLFMTILVIQALFLTNQTLLASGWFNQGIANSPDVKKVEQYLNQHFDIQVAQWITISEIPAPPKAEQRRAAYLISEIKNLGLVAKTDSIGNVWVTVKGTQQNAPAILFAAHMDTVFDEETDVTVTRKNNRLYGPGIWDNSASVANMMAVLRGIVETGYRVQGDVTFLATVQEEIGLNGMKFFMDNHKNEYQYVAALDGGLGPVLYGALGIYWMDMRFTAVGAHTLNSLNQPHPAKAAANCILETYDTDITKINGKPSAIFNVGKVHGGKIFNGIPIEVQVTVDLRTAVPEELQRLNDAIREKCETIAKNEKVGFSLNYATRIPAGGSPEKLMHVRNSDYVQTILAIQSYTGALKSGQAKALPIGSTDSNVAVVMGIPSFSIGRSYGKDQHTLHEWADIESARIGTRQILLLIASLNLSTK